MSFLKISDPAKRDFFFQEFQKTKREIKCEFVNFSSVRHSPTMRPQQDFSRTFCSCCCPPFLSCSFLVPLGLLSHYLSTSLVVFLCFLFPPLVRIALLPVVCFPPSLSRARTTSAFLFRFCLPV